MAGPVDRRDFLSPSRLAGVIGAAAASIENPAPAAPVEPIVTLKRQAMACLFEIQFSARNLDRKTPARAFETIDDLEDQLTVYRAESELSQINASAAERAVPVEPLLFALLKRCQGWFHETEKSFDITAGPLIRTWGFFRRQGRIPSDGEIAAALDRVGMDAVVLDDERKTVRFSRPGIELNLGAVGKGYALDRVAWFLRSNGFNGALLSAGRSSLRDVGAPAWDSRWRIDVTHPFDKSRVVAAIAFADGAMSTSGIGEQSFVHEGVRYGHILDPRTGRPASGVAQVSVVAPDAALAEALSTAFFIQGPGWAKDYCRSHPEVGAIVLAEDEEKPVEMVGRIEAMLAAGR